MADQTPKKMNSETSLTPLSRAQVIFVIGIILPIRLEKATSNQETWQEEQASAKALIAVVWPEKPTLSTYQSAISYEQYQQGWCKTW